MSVRLERAIQILVLLQSRVPYNTLQLANELKVHRRTVFRDIAALRRVGVDVQVDPESGGYLLPQDSAASLMALSDGELAELIAAAAFSPLATGGSARRAMLKLLRRLPAALREQTIRVIRAAEPEAPANGKSIAVDRVLESIRQHKVLEVVTDDPVRGSRKFAFQPQRFSFDEAGGKAVGRTHPDLRTAVLDLSAVREVRVTETPFVEIRFDPPHR